VYQDCCLCSGLHVRGVPRPCASYGPCGAGADVQYGGPGNDILHALANDNEADILDCGTGFDVAYVIEHDPVRLHGCERVIRLSPGQAAALAAANDDNG
jgi:Ca2+-binding RTX toxin-like protein